MHAERVSPINTMVATVLTLILAIAFVLFMILVVRALLKYLRSGEVRREKRRNTVSLGIAIKNHRQRCQMTQEFVAESLGVSRQAVSKWETDNSAPDTYNLIALAELFDVSVEYIAIGKQEDQQKIIPTEETKHSRIAASKIVGFVLLGAGLIALIFGLLLSEVLILLSVCLLIGGILCIAVRKKLWFVSMWTFLALTFLIISILTTQNLFILFNPSVYQGGLSMGMIVSYVFWLWLIGAVSITIPMVVKKHKTK